MITLHIITTVTHIWLAEKHIKFETIKEFFVYLPTCFQLIRSCFGMIGQPKWIRRFYKHPIEIQIRASKIKNPMFVSMYVFLYPIRTEAKHSLVSIFLQSYLQINTEIREWCLYLYYCDVMKAKSLCKIASLWYCIELRVNIFCFFIKKHDNTSSKTFWVALYWGTTLTRITVSPSTSSRSIIIH